MTKRRKLTYHGKRFNLRISDTPFGLFVHLDPKRAPKRGGYKTKSWRFATFKHATMFCQDVVQDI
ncbi:hypothetical protein HAP48_0042755 [Bradyrhizobium septentrionale]|uniref:Uncharacterized protein n=1 Tax=Bradyrhizobium septentrionale TaxID=1404411 RepID=A0A973W3C1_9BRAD|nr:hypothetical protein [Bradyrhizobium septentrionale]UGY15179.1 hypothetical protein HAP48_0042755 [Bradyrhizobium septentrionale]